MALVVIAVGVPIGVVELHKSRSSFYESSCQEAALAKLVGLLAADAVELLGRFRFVGSHDHFGGMGLHPVGQFVGFDAGGEFGVGRECLEVLVSSGIASLKKPALLAPPCVFFS